MIYLVTSDNNTNKLFPIVLWVGIYSEIRYIWSAHIKKLILIKPKYASIANVPFKQNLHKLSYNLDLQREVSRSAWKTEWHLVLLIDLISNGILIDK